MNSILNSISSGDLQVQKVPKINPVKEDSIIELLQNSEIEFIISPKKDNKPHNHFLLDSEFPLNILFELNNVQSDQNSILNDIFDLENLLLNSIIPLENQSVDDFNTGFGAEQDLHYETKCPIHKLKTPLYKENYLSEFLTEEEKADARHALGLYNKDDVVALSLLTTKDVLPSSDEWSNAIIKQMCLGDQFFIPITHINAVFDSKGLTLNTYLLDINSHILDLQKLLNTIVLTSSGTTISSLGDVKLFLLGFNKNQNLHEILDNFDQEMIRFEKTGLIK